MDSSLSALFVLYVFPTGRRIFAMRQVAARAKARDLADLAKHCTHAVTHDRACLALEQRWAGLASATPATAAPSDAAPATAVEIDRLTDTTLTAISDAALSQTAGTRTDDPIRATVTEFLAAVFPGGVQAITGLEFVDELAAVEHVVGLLRGPKLAPVVTELGLGRLTERLRTLVGEYRKALEAPSAAVMKFGEVRAARSEGQDLLFQAVAMIIGRYRTNSAEDRAARDELLGPILEQNDAIGAAMRGRRQVDDVNPESGTPMPAANVDGTPAPTAPTTATKPA
jgi:hypothetical protein